MIPDWLKNLKPESEILCVFGFSGEAHYVTIKEPVNINYTLTGYWVRYTKSDVDSIWFLDFEKYGDDNTEDSWLAYEVT